MTSENLKLSGHVLLQLIDPDGSVAEEREVHNLITTAGSQRAAQALARSLASGTPSAGDAFTTIALGVTSQSPAAPAIGNDLDDIGVASAEGLKTVETGYPKLADADPDNSAGSGTYVLTWYALYAAGTYTHTDITDVAITEAGAGFATSGEAIMNHAEFSAVNKGASQALKVFVNISVGTG